jgi:hypothetical protein
MAAVAAVGMDVNKIWSFVGDVSKYQFKLVVGNVASRTSSQKTTS